MFRIPDLNEGERLVGNDPDRGAHDKLLIQRLSDVWDIDLCPLRRGNLHSLPL